jgi:hypothetical protein
MFFKALQTLFHEQRIRISRICDTDRVDEAFEFLADNALDEVSIDRDCMKELHSILVKRNDVQITTSNRLNKYGWSTARIRDHMNRFFHSKMRAVGSVLKAAVHDPHANLQECLRGVMFSRQRQECEETDEEIYNVLNVQRGLRPMASSLDFD